MAPMPFRMDIDAPIGGGMFDTLPGGPWKILPPGVNRGFVLPALVANSYFEDTGESEGDFEFSGICLTVRNAGTYVDEGGREVGAFHFVGDEFEALMLLPSDLSHILMSCRGSKAAYAEAARILLDQQQSGVAE